MPENQRPCSGMEAVRWGTRAIWRELNCPNPSLQSMKCAGIRRKPVPVTGAAPCTGLIALWCSLRGAGRFPVRVLKEMNGAPKSR
jgi:hypothetical protein